MTGRRRRVLRLSSPEDEDQHAKTESGESMHGPSK